MYQRDKRHRSHNHNSNLNYRIKKTTIKDEHIDRQILVIHSAIVDKLLAQPTLIQQVSEQLEQRRESGRLNYSQYITWHSILELIDSPDEFKKATLEDTPKMRRYRRKTPLVNILTEEERQAALNASAIGEMADIQSILY